MTKSFSEMPNYCPRCGAAYTDDDFKDNAYICHECNFKYFQASTPATTIIIPSENDPYKILLTRRNIEPKKGAWDLPGGFLNFGEDPYKGIKREAEEELGIEVEVSDVIDVKIHDYEYQEYVYKNLVIHFLAEPVKEDFLADKSEIAHAEFVDLRKASLDVKEYAFPQDLEVIREYFKNLDNNS